MDDKLTIYKPIPIKKDKFHYYIFDLFIIQDKVYITLPLYKNYTAFRKIIIFHKNKPLPMLNNIFNNKHEPFQLLIYTLKDIPEEDIEIKLQFDNHVFLKKCNVIKNTAKFNISLSTLCKDDYKLTDIFIQYYANHGVESFNFYYNEKLTEKIIQYFSQLQEKYKHVQINLIEWNFPYWYYGSNNNTHHAQPAHIHHSLYLFNKNVSNYSLFCDLDEYIYLNNKSLKQFLLNNPTIDTVAFKNIWSRTTSSKIEIPLPNKFYASSICHEYGIRSKCIHKTDSIKSIAIHHSFYYHHLLQIQKFVYYLCIVHHFPF